MDKEKLLKVVKILKNYIILIPIIYVVGTMMQLIYYSNIGFPFTPITISQYAVLTYYAVIFMIPHFVLNAILCNILSLRKEFRKNIRQILLNILFWFIGFWVLREIANIFLTNKPAEIIIYYIMYLSLPVVSILIEKFIKIDVIKYLYQVIIISLYSTIAFYIPQTIGGLGRIDVNFISTTKNVSNIDGEFYGINNGMYYLKDSNNNYLIPVDKGYIKYLSNED